MKKTLNYIFLFALIAVTFWLLLKNINVNHLSYLIQHTDKMYILAALIMMAAFWTADAMIIRELSARTINTRKTFSVFSITMIGQYYGLVTPFALGSQPAQLYYMNKHDIPLGKGTVILLSKYVIYEVVVTVYSLTLYILHLKIFPDINMALIPFINIGFTVHIIGVAAIILITYSPKTLEGIIKFLLTLGKKLRLIRDLDEKLNSFRKFMKEYRSNLSLIINHKGLLIKTVFITFVQLTIYFYIPYLVYRALGAGSRPPLEIMSLQAMLYMAVSFIPTPGTLGASEAGYYTLFRSIFPTTEILSYSLLLWRGVTFYFNLIVSGLFSFYIFLINKKSKKSINDKNI